MYSKWMSRKSNWQQWVLLLATVVLVVVAVLLLVCWLGAGINKIENHSPSNVNSFFVLAFYSLGSIGRSDWRWCLGDSHDRHGMSSHSELIGQIYAHHKLKRSHNFVIQTGWRWVLAEQSSVIWHLNDCSALPRLAPMCTDLAVPRTERTVPANPKVTASTTLSYRHRRISLANVTICGIEANASQRQRPSIRNSNSEIVLSAGLHNISDAIFRTDCSWLSISQGVLTKAHTLGPKCHGKSHGIRKILDSYLNVCLAHKYPHWHPTINSLTLEKG